MDTPEIAGLFFILVFGVCIFVFAGGALAGRRPVPRTMSAFQTLPRQLGHAIESGQKLHVSLGTGGIGGSDTATTLAGLSVLEFLADEAAAADALPTVTVSDPTALVLAQDVLRRAHIRQGNLAGYDPRSVRYVAASPFPYAAGVIDILSNERTSANVMAGVFGLEAAFIADEGSRQELAQVAGAADAASLSVLYPTVDHLLVGEEMFAAGGYLSDQPARVASLLAQDLVRWILVLSTAAVSLSTLLVRLGMLLGGTTP